MRSQTETPRRSRTVLAAPAGPGRHRESGTHTTAVRSQDTPGSGAGIDDGIYDPFFGLKQARTQFMTPPKNHRPMFGPKRFAERLERETRPVRSVTVGA